MNLKQYLYLYKLLQELITQQITLYGPKVIGRWPFIELYNISKYPAKQISEFFATVLQYNTELHQKIVNDAKLNLQELTQELESIEILSGTDSQLSEKELEEIVVPTPDESVVNELLQSLVDKEPEVESEVKEEEIPLKVEEALPPPEPQEVEVKMSNELENQLLQLDAQFEILQDKLFIHPKFMESVSDLPEKIMKLFDQHGELTVKEVVTHLQIDASVRGVRIAFVVAWKQCAEELIDAESLL